MLGTWHVAKARRARISVLRSVSLALALLLHMAFFAWITLPAKPWVRTLRTRNESRPLHVDLTALRHAVRERVRPVASASPARPPHAQHMSPKPSVQPEQAIATSAPEQPTPPSAQATPLPPAIPYGNSSFNNALGNAQVDAIAMHVPGANEMAKVAGLHVQTPPSLAQRISDTGHWLRCKDALFKSRMTDTELQQRGLTERQMLQEFAALGCH
jgi:hypothetical protein